MGSLGVFGSILRVLREGLALVFFLFTIAEVLAHTNIIDLTLMAETTYESFFAS